MMSLETRRKMSETHRTPEVRKKKSEAMKKVKGTPEARKRASEAGKKRFEDPEERKKQSVAIKKHHKEHPETAIKMSQTMKKHYEDPENLRKTIEACSTPESREKQQRALKEYYKDPAVRKKSSETKKKYYKDNPEAREKISENTKKQFEDFEARENHSGVMKKAHIDRWWYGSVKYYDGPQYCEKWTENLRERVRAFFDYICVGCGEPQNGRRLSIHHIWYNKKLCCDDSPRLLVPLCVSCHMKTNSNRNYWSNYFQEIIDTYYDGRCWMTKEEFAGLKKKE